MRGFIMNNALQIKELIDIKLKEKKMTASKLLSDLGYNMSFFTDMKRKKSVPAADKLGYIAEYLDVSVDYLLGRTDNPEVNK